MKKDIRWLATYLWKGLRFLLVSAVIALVWSGAFYLVTNSGQLTTPNINNKIGELATLLFGAASVALFLFSIIVGAFAVIGWQVIERKIEAEVSGQTKKLENEIKGRVYSALGHMLGEMGINRMNLAVDDEEQLEEAVDNCKQGLKYLRDVGGPTEAMGLNNLIFYSCLKGTKDHGFLLAEARKMKASAELHEGDGAANLLITSCRAIIQYSDNSNEIDNARAILKDLLATSLPKKLKREAEIHLASRSRLDKAS